jgi:hypothetical protein
MSRFAAGGASVLLLMAAGFFLWKSYAQSHDPVPPAPAAVALHPLLPPANADGGGDAPPAASERGKEEKRFDRADKNKDGRITLAELYEPRRKAFAKLDSNHDGRLSFEEWAGKTDDRFTAADADHNGWLSRAEFATTKRKAKAKPARCAC